MTSWEEKFKELVIQAKALGFNHVDVYVPNKVNDEVVAFTFSTSEEYIKKVGEIEL